MPFQFAPTARFADPRRQPDFHPNDWPLCNGKEAPSWENGDAHERRCLEFLAAFYELNVLQSQLLTAHQAAEGPRAKGILARIQKATQRLEALEDHYAPIGFFGDPVMDGMRYRDIHFVRPALPAIYGPNSSVSSSIAIPGLDEIPVTERQGQLRVWRRNHGKMDL